MSTNTTTTTTVKMEKWGRLTLDDLRGFVEATGSCDGETEVHVIHADSQMDGQTTKLTVEVPLAQRPERPTPWTPHGPVVKR